MDTYGLNINLAGLEALPLIEFGISPIGKTILLHDIMGKRGVRKKQLENQLKSVIGSSNVIVDIDVQKGEVKVCGPQDKYDEIAAILCPIVEKAQERLLKEGKEVLVYPELWALLSTGIAIKEVILPGEFRDVKVILNTDIKKLNPW
ncbi:ATP-dependent RNA helicase DEAH12, chloroplastic [Caerostris extrusa]|uniref:ATP-dependent RNA helicase DEAH12, chloroplastic n=1 Tax=Caerostris extrusa TaxID=172846 RepID=A0AAV4SVV7_CAEEX|nr:ATP-dependent RNA helicase DEAH12, chloroplastic [Caerostris extrusa]